MLFIVEYIAFYCWYVRYHSVVICHLPFGTQPFASCLNIIRVVRHRYWRIPYSLSLTHSCISLSLSLTRVYRCFAHILIPIAIVFTYAVLATNIHAPVFISQALSYFLNAFSTVNQLHMNASIHNTVYIYENHRICRVDQENWQFFFLSIPVHAVYFFFIREIPYHWKHR